MTERDPTGTFLFSRPITAFSRKKYAFTLHKRSLLQATPRMGGGDSPLHSPRCILKRTTCDFLVIRSRCGRLSPLISWLYVPVVGNSAHSRYGKSRNCVWSEGAAGNAFSRDSRYFVRSATTGIRVAQLLGIPTLGRENFFIRERQLFSETKLNNKSPLQSLLFILEKVQSESQADFLKRFTFL